MREFRQERIVHQTEKKPLRKVDFCDPKNDERKNLLFTPKQVERE
jgi:hypothetical protein